MANSTNIRTLGVTNFSAGSSYNDVTKATITTSGTLIGSSTESDNWANHFAQMVELSQTVSVETFSFAAFTALRGLIGTLVPLSFTVPAASSSALGAETMTVNTNVGESGASVATAMVSSATANANTGAEGSYTIEFTIKNYDGGPGLAVTAAA